jgi:hypothetical protein
MERTDAQWAEMARHYGSPVNAQPNVGFWLTVRLESLG